MIIFQIPIMCRAFFTEIILTVLVVYYQSLNCSASLLPIVNNNSSFSSSLIKTNFGFGGHLATSLTLDDHICTREENYTELVRVPIKQPVRIRSQTWCLEIPPRCSNYRTEIRDVITVENITKTRIIRFCCEGYAGVISANETMCKPICRGGCGRGYCRSPDICKCDIGFIGKHCTQRCSHDKWGEDCLNECTCRNGAVCDNKNGACRCTSGWIGDKCEQTCAPGFYGTMCKRLCECSSERCNPQTGECISKETSDSSLKTNLQTLKTGSNLQTEIESEDKNLAIIESLNSSIENLNHNLDKLAKTLETDISDPTITILVPETTIFHITTEKSPDEVIVFQQGESPTILIANSASILKEEDLTKISPKVIHVIDLQQQLTSNLENSTIYNQSGENARDLSGIVTSFVLFFIVLLVAVVAFLVFYKKHLKNNSHTTEVTDSRNGTIMNTGDGFKGFVQPLPDLPAFTQNLRKTDEVPEFYDSPSNNTAVVKNSYSYAAPSLYSSVGPKVRKDSLENHLYDEIRYPSVKSCRV